MNRTAGLLCLSAALLSCGMQDTPEAVREMGGDPERGKLALQQYACVTCHVIPGVVGAKQLTGPPLTRMAKRTYIAGFLPNTPENMLKWLQDPKELAPRSAMPDLDVTEADARDMAAYLYRLE